MKLRITLLFCFILFSLGSSAQRTIPVVYNFLKAESHNYPERLSEWSLLRVEYIGYPQDSIYVGLKSNIGEQLQKHEVTSEFKKKYNISGHQYGRLQITICDTNIIKMLFDWSVGQDTNREVLNCYPIIVKNADTIPIEISIRRVSAIYIEKKNDNGNWKVINEPSYDCVTGDKRYYIMPKEIVVLSFPVADKNSYSNMRFRIGQNYSNTIRLK